MRIRGAVLEEIGRPRPYAGSEPLVVTDLELDPPGPGELLVRTETAGRSTTISGSPGSPPTRSSTPGPSSR